MRRPSISRQGGEWWRIGEADIFEVVINPCYEVDRMRSSTASLVKVSIDLLVHFWMLVETGLEQCAEKLS